MRHFAALIAVLHFAALAVAGEPRWKLVRAAPDDPRDRARAVCAAGDDLFAVGARAFHSTDGGATWSTGAPLPEDKGFVGGAHACFARSGREAFAVGASGHVYRTTDGATWARVPLQARTNFVAVAGNAELVIAVGEDGAAFVSRDGATWTAERVPTKETLRAIWVDADGGAVAAGEGGVLAKREPDGKWRAHAVTKDWFTAISGTRESLFALGTGGTVFRSTAPGKWVGQKPLPLPVRGSCGAYAARGRHLYASCRRAVRGSELVMEPPMEPFVLHSADDGATWTEEPALPGLFALTSAASGVFAVGDGIWRRED